jgi:hypothetical protein
MGLRCIGQVVASQKRLSSSGYTTDEHIWVISPREAPQRKQSAWGTRPGLLRGGWLRSEPQPAGIELVHHWQVNCTRKTRYQLSAIEHTCFNIGRNDILEVWGDEAEG